MTKVDKKTIERILKTMLSNGAVFVEISGHMFKAYPKLDCSKHP
jgi:hypothetical protein